MTDIKLLELLNDYYVAQKNVVNSMRYAMRCFEHGHKVASWDWLFNWCEDKECRDELVSKFERNYKRAIALKEGVKHD